MGIFKKESVLNTQDGTKSQPVGNSIDHSGNDQRMLILKD
jgi:hypothetical protein